MAGLDGVLARPDVPVFLLVAAVHLGLRHLRPFLGAVDIRQGAENLLDADLGAVRRAGLDTVAVIPEALLLPDLMGEAAEKLAGRALLPADAVLDRLALASVLFPERPAWADGSEEHWVRWRAAVVLCIPGADQFAA